jgi:hypothetical protein
MRRKMNKEADRGQKTGDRRQEFYFLMDSVF